MSGKAYSRKPGTRAKGASARPSGGVKAEARSGTRLPEAKNLTSPKPKNRCPDCNSTGQYNEKYDDLYCWECKEYFKDMK